MLAERIDSFPMVERCARSQQKPEYDLPEWAKGATVPRCSCGAEYQPSRGVFSSNTGAFTWVYFIHCATCDLKLEAA